jgi:hypothetical protein
MTSHADTLQILQTYFLSSDEGVDPRHFHRYRFSNGEVRIMCLMDVYHVMSLIFAWMIACP